MTNQELTNFVLRYYQQGKFNTQQAMKTVLERLKTNEQLSLKTEGLTKLKTDEQTRRTGFARVFHISRSTSEASVHSSSRLRYAAAVAVLCVLVGTAFALFYHSSGRNVAEPPAVTTQQPSSTAQPMTFHFDDTPINDVLSELDEAYGTSLQASDTTKHLTGDFEAESPELLISIIEQTLGIEIMRNEK